jgi:hypothetical protein
MAIRETDNARRQNVYMSVIATIISVVLYVGDGTNVYEYTCAAEHRPYPIVLTVRATTMMRSEQERLIRKAGWQVHDLAGARVRCPLHKIERPKRGPFAWLRK